MNLGDLARGAASRVLIESRYAATLVRAAGPQVVSSVNPAEYVNLLRSVIDYGIEGSATAAAKALNPRGVAVIDDAGSLTFDELHRNSSALAASLHARGVDAESSLGILCRNHREFFEIFFAAGKLGCRTLLLNTDFSGPQLADVCQRESITVIIGDEEFAERIQGLPAEVLVVMAACDTAPDGAIDTVRQLIAKGAGSKPPKPSHAQRVVLLTSGTTGTPKGAPRDIDISLAAPGGFLSKVPMRAGRSVLIAAPLFHAWGLATSMLAFGLGNTIVLNRSFAPQGILDSLERHKVDTLVTLPILLARLIAIGEPEIKSRDLGALRVIALSGSALSADLATRAMDILGDIAYNMYGSTEVAFVAIATPKDLRAAPGTVGRPPYGTSIRIMDADDREVPVGTPGRIFVRSTLQFGGYTDGANKKVTDGFMSTGDMGHLDPNGRLFVEGRDDDMIVSGGENVFPAEIEELITAHPQVSEAAVIGIPDEEFGARLRAYVVADGQLDAEGVRDYVRANLARYKVPRDVIFVDEIPRNPAGKIVKRLLPDPD
ncbi:MAG: AMP-binding protein [Aeromicrobium sp.]